MGDKLARRGRGAQPGTNSEPGNEGQGRVALQGKNYEEQINEARALVNQDPARVAQVVNSWVSGND
jgi:flagellar biosynthesis/type III secretory pathway M-ring protein FliF/YscJ